MKQLYTLMYFILIYATCTLAQKQKSNYIFNEFGISGNYSIALSSRYETHSSFGSGVSICKSFRENSHINPVAGIDYNFTHFEIDSIRSAVDHYYTDARFRYNQFRFPLSLRFQIGKKTKFFIETGTYFNVLLSGSLIAKSHKTYLGEEIIKLQKVRLNRRSGIGVTLGMGIQLPVKSGYLIFKADVNKGFGNTILSQGSFTEEPLFYNSYLRLAVIYKLGDFMKKQE